MMENSTNVFSKKRDGTLWSDRKNGEHEWNQQEPRYVDGDDRVGSFGYDMAEKKSRSEKREEPVCGKRKRREKGGQDKLNEILSKKFRDDENSSEEEIEGEEKSEIGEESDSKESEDFDGVEGLPAGPKDFEDEKSDEDDGSDADDGMNDSLDFPYSHSIIKDIEFKISNLAAPYSKNTKDLLTDFFTKKGIDVEISGTPKERSCICTLGNRADKTRMESVNGKLFHGKALKISLSLDDSSEEVPTTLWFLNIDKTCITKESLGKKVGAKDVTIHYAKRRAYVTFTNVQKARNLLKQGVVTVGGCDMKVTAPQPVKEINVEEQICFFCGKLGHTIIDCPVGGNKTKICRKCHKQGHIERECKFISDLDHIPTD